MNDFCRGARKFMEFNLLQLGAAAGCGSVALPVPPTLSQVENSKNLNSLSLPLTGKLEFTVKDPRMQFAGIST